MHPFQLSATDLKVIADKFAKKKILAQERAEDLFGVFEQIVDLEEQIALKFLYAFMPLVDLADYNGELFLQHVQQSLETKQKMSWGAKINGELFLHYVLPYRISNETIENYRPYFFNELYDRIKNFSMAEAILEINHWCHEKATYIATDPRTASPLTVVRTAQGRCGEESTLLVAALRSLGIPARQVYTPRWAHTDSNHAWVEAWADGEWFYLGACEPEPKLNMGWFSGPATRAMLIHTKVPSTIYRGPEGQVQVGDDYTELNLLPNYAPTQNLEVVVQDQLGQPIEGATVEFQVFNYGGFSSLVSLKTKENGKVSITTGYGDLFVHASADQLWGFVVAKGTGPRLVKVVVGAAISDSLEFEFLVPSESIKSEPAVSADQQNENTRRLKKETEIRVAYEATFVTREKAEQLATELNLDQDKIWDVLEKARGNSHEIAAFIKEAVPEHGSVALELLHVLSPKDLTDTTSSVLLDHLEGALLYEGLYGDPEFFCYVLQPRVSLEVLRPFREFFQAEFSLNQQEVFRHNPLEIQGWIERNIRTLDDEAVRGWPTPKGVYELKQGNVLAKQILFVALARSYGVAARLSAIDGKAQYLHEEDWINVQFGPTTLEPLGSGTIRFHKSQDYRGKVNYYQNFSLARLENGIFQTLRFKGLDEEAFDDQSFSERLEVGSGCYRLTTGHRLTDGKILVNLLTFTVKAKEIKDLELVFMKAESALSNLGQLPQDLIFPKFGEVNELVVDDVRTEQGVILIWLELHREPTKHLIRDLIEQNTQFDSVGIPVVFCLAPEQITKSFHLDDFQGLPKNVVFVWDENYQGLAKVQLSLGEKQVRNFPIVVVADRDGVIRYLATGYQIGTGTHMLDCSVML